MRRINFIVILIVIYALTCSCGGIKSLEVGEPESFSFKGVKDNVVTIELALPVNNPNPYKFTLTAIDMDIWVNNSFIGTVEEMNKTEIPGNFDGVQDFVLDVKMNSLLGGLFSFFSLMGKDSITVEMKGTIRGRYLLLSKEVEINEKNIIEL